MRRSPGTQSYTVDPDSPASAVAAVYRVVLEVMRDRLQVFYVDLLSDSPWPAEAMGALAALGPRAPQRRRFFGLGKLERGITVELDLSNDYDMTFALALVPWTISAEGWSKDDVLEYAVSDTGTSASFELTPADLARVIQRLGDEGVDPRALEVLPD